MSVCQQIARSVIQSVIDNLLGRSSEVDTLVFHALDDVDGTYVNDIIVGNGVLVTQDPFAYQTTRYFIGDTGVWLPYAPGVPAQVYAGGKWWLVSQNANVLGNLQIWSNDLTNAEWTASNMTVAKNAVGMTGAANEACTLTATSANATVLGNVVTFGSNNFMTRWFIKRLTGTGTIEVTVNGGTAWQDVTTEVDSTAGFNECLEGLLAFANPQVGIRIQTDTDAVIVGNSELYGGAPAKPQYIFKSSPIFTGDAAGKPYIATSNSYVPSTNHSHTEGLWYCEIMNAGLNSTTTALIISIGPQGEIIRQTADGTSFESYDTGPTVVEGPAITLAADETVYKVAVAYGSSLRSVATNGVWGTEGTYSGHFGAFDPDDLYVTDDSSPYTGTFYIRNVRRHNVSYANALILGTTLTG